MSRIRALLFDLDGTLLDTAPEMATALNQLRQEEKLDPLPFDAIRPTVSHGSFRMVSLAFANAVEDEFERLRQRFLHIYRDMLGSNTRLFVGCEALLAELEARNICWGVVTNKPGWLTEPLLDILNLRPTRACVVSGDTLSERKPHPLPLLHAARLISAAPADCLYVGDAERDIQAGNAAGMRTVVAQWGYLDKTDRPEAWRAHGLARQPLELLDWLRAVP